MNPAEQIPEKKLKVLELKTPAWAEKYKEGEDVFWLHDTCYKFAILSSEKLRADDPTKPEIFAMNIDGFLAVSDTYPQQYRNLGILHEAKEFSEPLDEASCARALEYELNEAPLLQVYNIPKYLEFRLDFFEKVIAYYENKERQPTENKLLARLQRGREYLVACINTAQQKPEPD